MDLYRYFHPHHNPRLSNTPLRQQELGETLQASIELRNAIKRAELRTGFAPIAGIRQEHFSEILVALNYVIESLETLNQAHPGDEPETMKKMLEERKHAPGWENWCCLLNQQLQLYDENQDSSLEITNIQIKGLVEYQLKMNFENIKP